MKKIFYLIGLVLVYLLVITTVIIIHQKRRTDARYIPITIGAPDAGEGDNLYTAFTKVNQNLDAHDDSVSVLRALINAIDGGGVWGYITGTLSNQTDLQNALNAKAPTVSPTITTSATLPTATTIGSVSATEIGYLDGVTSGIQTQLNDTTTLDLDLNAQTGTSYTLALSDNYGMVTLSNAAAITLTVPPNSSVAFPVGAIITIAQTGAGQVTVSPGGGVTVNAAGSADALRVQYSAATLVKLATDTWILMGDIK